MIEVFNADRTNSLGCFDSFKAAKGTLTILANNNELGENPAVLVCSYKDNEPQREYVATYSRGRWRVPKLCNTPQSTGEPKKKRCRKIKLHKEYSSPEACFNEGFPDWMNRSYPVPSYKRQGLNVRMRVNATTYR